MWGFAIGLLGVAVAATSYALDRRRASKAPAGGTTTVTTTGTPTGMTPIPDGVIVPAGTTLTAADTAAIAQAMAQGAPLSDMNGTLAMYYIYQTDFNQFVQRMLNAGITHGKDPAQTPVGSTPTGLTFMQFANYYH